MGINKPEVVEFGFDMPHICTCRSAFARYFTIPAFVQLIALKYQRAPAVVYFYVYFNGVFKVRIKNIVFFVAVGRKG